MVTGTLIIRKNMLPLLRVYDREKICAYVIRLVNRLEMSHVLQFFYNLVKNLEFRGIYPTLLMNINGITTVFTRTKFP